jgi:glycosyltransferase involved in cell wall biosynthesis
MRILMIAPPDSPHSIRPVQWLIRAGHQVAFMADHDPFKGGRERVQFVKAPSFRAQRRLEKVAPQLAFIAEWIFVRVPLRRICRKLKIDVVHVSWVGPFAGHCAKTKLHPLVFTVWGSDVNKRLAPDANPVVRQDTGEALAQADLILVDSGDMFEKCTALAGRELPIKLHRLGIDMTNFKRGYQKEALAWRRKLNIAGDTLVYLHIRGLGPVYGHSTLLQAFARVRPRLKRNAILVINRLSAVAEYEREMRHLACTLGVGEMVRWMDPVPMDQLPTVYAGSDIVVNVPIRDAFPVAFIEAAACERPVITCDLPAYRDTFAEKCFLLVESCNVNQLTGAMVSVADEGGREWAGRVAEARRIVVSEYDETRCAEELIAHYRRLVVSPGTK